MALQCLCCRLSCERLTCANIRVKFPLFVSNCVVCICYNTASLLCESEGVKESQYKGERWTKGYYWPISFVRHPTVDKHMRYYKVLFRQFVFSSLTLYVRSCSPTFYKVLQRFDTCEILDGLFVLRAYLTTHSDILNPECSSAKASRRYWVKIFALVVKFFG